MSTPDNNPQSDLSANTPVDGNNQHPTEPAVNAPQSAMAGDGGAVPPPKSEADTPNSGVPSLSGSAGGTEPAGLAADGSDWAEDPANPIRDMKDFLERGPLGPAYLAEKARANACLVPTAHDASSLAVGSSKPATGYPMPVPEGIEKMDLLAYMTPDGMANTMGHLVQDAGGLRRLQALCSDDDTVRAREIRRILAADISSLDAFNKFLDSVAYSSLRKSSNPDTFTAIVDGHLGRKAKVVAVQTSLIRAFTAIGRPEGLGTVVVRGTTQQVNFGSRDCDDKAVDVGAGSSSANSDDDENITLI